MDESWRPNDPSLQHRLRKGGSNKRRKVHELESKVNSLQKEVEELHAKLFTANLEGALLSASTFYMSGSLSDVSVADDEVLSGVVSNITASLQHALKSLVEESIRCYELTPLQVAVLNALDIVPCT
jgi:hypothetical protein